MKWILRIINSHCYGKRLKIDTHNRYLHQIWSVRFCFIWIGGKVLARYEISAREFLYPTPTLTGKDGMERELLLSRTVHFTVSCLNNNTLYHIHWRKLVQKREERIIICFSVIKELKKFLHSHLRKTTWPLCNWHE